MKTLTRKYLNLWGILFFTAIINANCYAQTPVYHVGVNITDNCSSSCIAPKITTIYVLLEDGTSYTDSFTNFSGIPSTNPIWIHVPCGSTVPEGTILIQIWTTNENSQICCYGELYEHWHYDYEEHNVTLSY